jgi:hypothetical protein
MTGKEDQKLEATSSSIKEEQVNKTPPSKSHQNNFTNEFVFDRVILWRVQQHCLHVEADSSIYNHHIAHKQDECEWTVHCGHSRTSYACFPQTLKSPFLLLISACKVHFIQRRAFLSKCRFHPTLSNHRTAHSSSFLSFLLPNATNANASVKNAELCASK